MSSRFGRFRRRRETHDEQDEEFDQYETLTGDAPIVPAARLPEREDRAGTARPGPEPAPEPERELGPDPDDDVGFDDDWDVYEDTDEDWAEPPPGPSLRERLGGGGGLGSRLAIGVPGVLLAIAVVVVGGGIFAAAVGVLAILALYEFYSLTAAWRPLRWAGYVGVIATVAMAWGVTSADQGVLIGIAIGMGCVALAGLLVARRDDITGRMAATAFGLIYVGLPFGLLVATRQLPHGGGAVANVLVGTWVFDTASFVGGKLWGRRHIAPFVSPGKTLEGLVIGVIFGTGAVWIAGLYMSWISGWDSVIVGLVICAAGFVGDLFESMLKRDIGVKDSGRLLLAHGGVLDRFDALMFATVAAYFVTVALV
jgi:phosphatidate cytidylyltransferase